MKKVDKIRFREIRLEELDALEAKHLAKTAKGLPRGMWRGGSFDREKPVPYLALVQELGGREAEGMMKDSAVVFYVSGILAGAKQNWGVAEAIGEQLTEKGRVTAVSIGSSISADVAGSRPVVDPVERSMYLLALLGRVLKENPCSKFLVVAHSMGAKEVLTALANHEDYFEKQGIAAQLEGLVLAQPLGVVSQSMGEWFEGFGGATSGRDEVETMIPSMNRWIELQDEKDEARGAGDAGWMLRVERELAPLEERMENFRRRYVRERVAEIRLELERARLGGDDQKIQRLKLEKDPLERTLLELEKSEKNEGEQHPDHNQENETVPLGGHLSEDQLKVFKLEKQIVKKVEELDYQIWKARTEGRFKRERELLRKRKKVLTPFVSAAVEGEAPPQLSLDAVVRSVQYVGGRVPEMLGVMPVEIRRMIDVPVGMIGGDMDAYFPEKRMDQRVPKDFFPYAGVMVRGVLKNWAHASPAIEKQRFAEMVGSVVRRLRQWREENGEDKRGDGVEEVLLYR